MCNLKCLAVAGALLLPTWCLALRQVSLGKEEGCNDCIAETFRRSPVGTLSHPVELGQQPEASLASWSVRPTAKRRQRAFRPCY